MSLIHSKGFPGPFQISIVLLAKQMVQLEELYPHLSSKYYPCNESTFTYKI